LFFEIVTRFVAGAREQLIEVHRILPATANERAIRIGVGAE
jgi:hypothetical protein